MHAHTYKCVHTYARRWLELCGAKHGRSSQTAGAAAAAVSAFMDVERDA